MLSDTNEFSKGDLLTVIVVVDSDCGEGCEAVSW